MQNSNCPPPPAPTINRLPLSFIALRQVRTRYSRLFRGIMADYDGVMQVLRKLRAHQYNRQLNDVLSACVYCVCALQQGILFFIQSIHSSHTHTPFILFIFATPPPHPFFFRSNKRIRSSMFHNAIVSYQCVCVVSWSYLDCACIVSLQYIVRYVGSTYTCLKWTGDVRKMLIIVFVLATHVELCFFCNSWRECFKIVDFVSSCLYSVREIDLCVINWLTGACRDWQLPWWDT